MPEPFLSRERLQTLCGRFSQSPIAVVGDFFLDEYLILDKNLSEKSIETGLEAHQVVGARKSPGVAGTVTNILRSLGLPVIVVGTCGDDGHGYELRRCLTEQQINIDHFFTLPGRFTPTYTKPMLLDHGHETELSRLDTKNRCPITPEQEQQIITALHEAVLEVNALLIVDQKQENSSGVVTNAVRSALAELAEKYPEKIFIADSRNYMGRYRNVMVKFNVHEAARTLGIPEPNGKAEEFEALACQLFQFYHQPVILTLGERGMQLTDEHGTAWVPAIPLQGEVDIVGAGDSVLASIGAALSVGASLIEAAIIGTITASIIVQQIGTTGIATPEEIMGRFEMVADWMNSTVVCKSMAAKS
jgi:rfaE bifunctional protein kinase chain/domain